MAHRITQLLALSAASLALPLAAQAPPIDAELESLRIRHEVPGLSYAGLTDCRIDEQAYLGFADLGTGRVVDEHTLFEAASLSKPVLAWIVMSLVEEGRIDLDRGFAEEGFAYPMISDTERYARLTPRLVLTHRTGLPNWAGNSLDPDTPRAIEFSGAPDSGHTYSGEGFQLLQAYVEQRTGKSLGELFSERLGKVMPHSSFRRPLRPGTNESVGYDSSAKPDAARVMTPVLVHELSAASLATTAADYARFMGMICRHEGLAEATYAEMLRPQTPAREGQHGFSIRWALGWSIIDLDGSPMVLHTGNNGEYRAVAAFLPEMGMGHALFTNSATGEEMIEAFMLAGVPGE